jgi:hypothetical protein
VDELALLAEQPTQLKRPTASLKPRLARSRAQG